ncbi:hypothetical protein L1987_05770 [Smallanthus sonchifolius]|uniref:Uncharacterized protein n=1 Tax=Smallanthus sonchifolius TaxID=185202 RepID=A0ACB9JWG5_9ASTR|nr:hypothetical protein L1987_05770 [Smallanthus sonchifolius]
MEVLADGRCCSARAKISNISSHSAGSSLSMIWPPAAVLNIYCFSKGPSERNGSAPKASGPRRWIVLFQKLGLQVLPCGDRTVGEGVKPSKSTTREREWKETQVDYVLRYTSDIEGITYTHEAGQMSSLGIRDSREGDGISRPEGPITGSMVYGTSRWWVSVTHVRKRNWASRTYLVFAQLFQTLPEVAVRL